MSGEGPEKGECVRLISRLMACRISLQDWRMLRKDHDARYVYSTLGAYTKLGLFLDNCYSAACCAAASASAAACCAAACCDAACCAAASASAFAFARWRAGS